MMRTCSRLGMHSKGRTEDVLYHWGGTANRHRRKEAATSHRGTAQTLPLCHVMPAVTCDDPTGRDLLQFPWVSTRSANLYMGAAACK